MSDGVFWAFYLMAALGGCMVGIGLSASWHHRHLTSIIKASVFEHDGNGYQVRKVGEA